jgi:ABC-type transport system substrate-binding protein/DNA-binding SARP family transcriptional activator
VEFRILGPMEVWAGGALVPLGGPKQRAVLALLLLHRGRVVSRDALIDAIWGERPPPSAGHTLEAYVHRLRKLLGDGVLLTRAPGYRLELGDGQLDLDRFERLVEEAGEQPPERAAPRLREALGLWRGPPFADLAPGLFPPGELEALQDRREGALEDRIEADLARGRQRELVPELQTLVARFPLRERLRAQLMLALHRSGRRADALAAYRDARAQAVEALGLEPGLALRELHAAILRDDPAVAPPRTPLVALPRRRGPRAAAVLVALALAGTVAAGGGGAGPPPVRGDALVAVDASGHTSAVALAGGPSAVAAGFGSLWVAEPRRNLVARAGRDGRVTDTIRVGSGPGAIAAGAGAVWVANGLDGTISRVDPGTATVVQTIRVPGTPAAVAVAAGSVWVAGDDVVRIDAGTGRVRGTVHVEGHATAIAAAAGGVWVTAADARTLWRLDARTAAATARIPLPGGAAALAFDGHALWVAGDSGVTRVDPVSGAVTATVPTGGTPAGLAAAAGRIWVADEARGRLLRIDPEREEVTREVRLEGRPSAVAAIGARVWVGVRDRARRHRGGTLVLLNPSREFDSIDPAIQHAVEPAQLLGMTNDGLVTFAHVGGREGTQLVPDLATALPAPTDDGRTYTFRLRSGIRYSDGTPVRASDIRRGIERLSALGSGEASAYAGIRVIADDERGTITFHLRAPDPDLLFKLALPYAYAVPPGTPDHDVGLHPVPATGPYMIARYRPGHELRLVRNPEFREWSERARPDGFPDEIVWRLGVAPEDGIAEVLAGRADWMLSIGQALPAARLRDLERRFPSRLHVNPLMQTDYMILNVRVPPFDDVRVRRALNLALDRRAIARLFGRGGARPTCQVLPPQMPGYTRYCPYGSRPALATARRLVAASGTRGMKVVVWDTPEAGTFLEEGRATVALLRRLGYRASLRLVPDAEYARTSGNSRHRVQVSSGGWSADYPAPGSFIALKLSCRAFRPRSDYVHNAGGFCDPALDRRVERAQRLQAARPDEANAAWGRIERRLVDEAVWLPMVTPSTTDLVSRRVGDYQFHPLWGLLVDQLWVR